MMFVAAVILTGCKKEDTIVDPPANNGSTSVQQISEDDNRLQRIDDDINLDIEMMMSTSTLKSTDWLPCNAILDSTVILNDTITYYITYNGLNCPGNHDRHGKMEIRHRVGEHWFNIGATVFVKIINLQITNIHNQKTVVINGVKTHQNVTGGLLVQLGLGIDHVLHKTHGFMTVNFDNGTNRTWNIARRIVYTGNFNLQIMNFDELVIGIDGFGQVGEYTNLVTWGVGRNGEQFYTSVPHPVHYPMHLNFVPADGIQSIDIPSANKGATVTYGYDSNNQPVVPPACPTKYKVDWYHGSSSGTIYLWL